MTTSSISANEVMWKFFLDHPLTAGRVRANARALSAVLAAGMVAAVVAIAAPAPARTAAEASPACAPGGPPVELGSALVPSDAKTYLVLPVDVGDGTTRIEVGY